MKTKKRQMMLRRFCRHHSTDLTSIELLDIFGCDCVETPFLLEGRNGSQMLQRDAIISIQGARKSGKSSLALAMALAVTNGQYLGNTAHERDCSCLWCDLEQGEGEVRKRLRYALASIGVMGREQCKNFHAVSFKVVPKQQRIEKLAQAIDEVLPDLVVVDGVADLVSDFNDPRECFAIAERLGEIVEKRHISIISIIHEKRGSNEAKGHIGSAIDQKAYQLWSVSKKGNVSTAHYIDGRGASCEDFEFTFDEHGVPQPSQDSINCEKAESWQIWNAICSELGNTPGGYSNKVLVEAYMSHANCKKRTADSCLKRALDFGTLVRHGEGKNTRYNLCFADIQINEEDDLL